MNSNRVVICLVKIQTSASTMLSLAGLHFRVELWMFLRKFLQEINAASRGRVLGRIIFQAELCQASYLVVDKITADDNAYEDMTKSAIYTWHYYM